MRERIAEILFQDDVIHGHLQNWESPTADWGQASKNLKQAYYDFADSILKEITEGLTVINDIEISQRIQQDTGKWAITNREFLMDCAHVISNAQLQHIIKQIKGE